MGVVSVVLTGLLLVGSPTKERVVNPEPIVSAVPLKEHLSNFYRIVDTVKPWNLSPPAVSESRKNSYLSAELVKRFMDPEVLLLDLKTDMIIGDVPGETLLVTGEWSYDGNIHVINDGVFLVKNATVTLNGDITASGAAMVDIDSSYIRLIQYYRYERTWIVVDSAIFRVRNTTTNYGGYPIGLAIMGVKPTFVWENVQNVDFTTAMVLGGASVTVRDVDLAGEWVICQNSTLTFSNIGLMLHWYTFGEGVVVDFTFPPSPVYDFVMDSTQPGISGIGYSVYVDSVDTMWWGSMSRAGSDVTFRDSEMRIMGLMFDTDDSVSLSGLVNYQTYTDFTLPLLDRTLRFVNTRLETWNLYPGFHDSIIVAPYLSLTGSIVGEIIGLGQSQVWAQNYTLDGSGGHLEANGGAFVLSFLSSIMSDVITKDNSVAVIGWSSQLFSSGWATDNSRLIYLNTYTPSDPIPLDSATVWMVNLEGPVQGYIEDTVDIVGSAWVDGGPLNSVDMIKYQLFYRPRGDLDWIAIDTAYTSEIRRGILGHWDTEGLSTGPYDLALIVWDTDVIIDSLVAYSSITLLPAQGIIEQEPKVDSKLSFSVSTSPRGLNIEYLLPENNNVAITVYTLDGRRVAALVSGEQSAGTHSLIWQPRTSGIYLLRMNTPAGSITRKVIWVH